MPASAFGELAHVSSEMLLVNARKTHGYSVRRKMNETGDAYKTPTRLHLFYIALDGKAQFTVRHLGISNVSKNNIFDQEKILFEAAKKNVEEQEDSDYLLSKDFEAVVFRYPAFFTLVIDEEDWEFYHPAYKKDTDVIKDETHDPIVFIDKKTVVEQSSDDGKTITCKIQDFHENHAFFDATKTSIKGMSAVRLINYLTNEKGEALKKGDEPLRYGFEIYLRAPCAVAGRSEHRTTIIIDPDGENQGPPS